MTVHFILSGETLENIAEEINLENPEYLKEFHNAHCAREDIVNDRLVPGKKLLLPDFKTVNEYNSRNDAPCKAPELNPDIPFFPEEFSKIYTVTINETEENALDEKSTMLTYTASVKWMEKKGTSHIFSVFKNNFFDAQGSMMSDLASESIRALNPFIVTTNEKGKILTIQLNENAANHFGRIKERLLDLFPDPYAAMYLDEFEFAVMDRDLFERRMKEDIFMNLYFASLRNGFKNGNSFLRQFIEGENLQIDLMQKVEDRTDPEEIILRQHGIPDSDPSIAFDGKYTVLAGTGLVKNAEVRYTVTREDIKTSTFITVE